MLVAEHWTTMCWRFLLVFCGFVLWVAVWNQTKWDIVRFDTEKNWRMNWIRPEELYNKLNLSFGLTVCLSRPHYLFLLGSSTKQHPSLSLKFFPIFWFISEDGSFDEIFFLSFHRCPPEGRLLHWTSPNSSTSRQSTVNVWIFQNVSFNFETYQQD